MGILHKFTSAYADDVDTTLVRPSNWNDQHAMSLDQAEISLVAAPDARRSGHAQITGLAGLTAGKQVLIEQAPGPYTGKGTRTDEAEMDAISATAVVLNAGTIDVYWNSQYRVRGNYKFNYLVMA